MNDEANNFNLLHLIKNSIFKRKAILIQNGATQRMEQNVFKNANNCLNTKIYSYLETSGCQSSNLYLDVVHLVTIVHNTNSKHLEQLRSNQTISYWIQFEVS